MPIKPGIQTHSISYEAFLIVLPQMVLPFLEHLNRYKTTIKDKMMDDKINFHHFVVHYFVFQKSLFFAHIEL